MSAIRIESILQAAFICHRRPDRSFHCYGGKQFPVCARCTGILFGYIVGIISAIFSGPIFFVYALLMLVPTAIDGFVQLLTSYESTNARRFLSGTLAGVGIIYIFVFIGSKGLAHGIWIAQNLF